MTPRKRLSDLALAILEAELGPDPEATMADVIARVRQTDPSAYIRAIASLVPTEAGMEGAAELSDAQLDQALATFAAALE